VLDFLVFVDSMISTSFCTLNLRGCLEEEKGRTDRKREKCRRRERGNGKRREDRGMSFCLDDHTLRLHIHFPLNVQKKKKKNDNNYSQKNLGVRANCKT